MEEEISFDEGRRQILFYISSIIKKKSSGEGRRRNVLFCFLSGGT